ncbi:MAG TPA: acyltransferase family protein, partial [Hyphomicrobiales bacterium]
NVPGFSGGFVGVDIFFVISGFLITSLIYSEIQLGKFSLAHFYLRRAKRIFPALSVVLASTTIASWFILLPDEFFKYGKSLVATAFFVSNFHFRLNVGYFDGAAIYKPLLHTWSLAIEEQFYIIFPLLLLALSFRANRQRLMLLAFGFTLIGLFATEITVRQNTETAFYLLPFRGWELILGAGVAFGVQSSRITNHTALILSLLGGVAIATSIILLDENSLFPGLNAVPACGGAALLILCGSHNLTVIQRLLAQRAIVFIGLISYSLYLWHWPIFSLSRYHLNRELSAVEAAFAIVASMALAAITWKFVESPVRHSKLGRMRPLRAIAYTTLPLIALAAMGNAIRIGAGIPWRLPDKIAVTYINGRQHPVLNKLCHGVEKALINDGKCNFGTEIRDSSFDMVIWGDSHADHFVPAFTKIAHKWGWSGRQITGSRCIPMWGVSEWSKGNVLHRCEDFDRIMDEFLRRNPKLKLVVLASRWADFATRLEDEAPDKNRLFLIDRANKEISYQNTRKVMAERLMETVTRLSARGLKVVIIGQVPASSQDPLNCMARELERAGNSDSCRLPRAKSLDYLRFTNQLISAVGTASDPVRVRSILTTDYLCDDGGCRIELGGQPLYADFHHLSNVGSQQLSGYLFDQLDDFVRSPLPQKATLNRGPELDPAGDGLAPDRLIIAK